MPKIIINKSHKSCKKSHNHQGVFCLSKCSQLFILFNFIFKNKKNKSYRKDQETGSNISKHYSKQKWKCNWGNNGWVDLHIRRYGIKITNQLKKFEILIRRRACWGVYLLIFNLSNLNKSFCFLLVLILQRSQLNFWINMLGGV